MHEPKFISKEEIEKLFTSPLSEDKISSCRDSHLLVNVRKAIITGGTELGIISK